MTDPPQDDPFKELFKGMETIVGAEKGVPDCFPLLTQALHTTTPVGAGAAVWGFSGARQTMKRSLDGCRNLSASWERRYRGSGPAPGSVSWANSALSASARLRPPGLSAGWSGSSSYCTVWRQHSELRPSSSQDNKFKQTLQQIHAVVLSGEPLFSLLLYPLFSWKLF